MWRQKLLLWTCIPVEYFYNASNMLESWPDKIYQNFVIELSFFAISNNSGQSHQYVLLATSFQHILRQIITVNIRAMFLQIRFPEWCHRSQNRKKIISRSFWKSCFQFFFKWLEWTLLFFSLVFEATSGLLVVSTVPFIGFRQWLVL